MGKKNTGLNALAKSIIIAVVVGVLALLYVDQQVRLFTLGYRISAAQERINALREENKLLESKLLEACSLKRVESYLAAHPEFVLPQRWQVVKLGAPETEVAAKVEEGYKGSRF